MKSWGNHPSEIPSCVIIYRICRQHHKHEVLSKFLHEYIFNAVLGTFAFSYENVVWQFWISGPKAVIAEKSDFEQLALLMLLFIPAVRSWTRCLGLCCTTNLSPESRHPDTGAAHCMKQIHPKKKVFSNTKPHNSSTHSHFDLFSRQIPWHTSPCSKDPTPRKCKEMESFFFRSTLFSFEGGKMLRIISFSYNFVCCTCYSENW